MAVRMAMIGVWLNSDERGLASALQEAGDKLDSRDGEVVVDFASVERIDLGALQAMEGFAGIADEKAVKVVLRGVNVSVYKVLKLMKLAQRFSFVSRDDSRGVDDLEKLHAEPSAK
jgi:anti-anti-sigma regulatory factor